MTPTLHKILEKALLSIGQLSEETTEARNKYPDVPSEFREKILSITWIF